MIQYTIDHQFYNLSSTVEATMPPKKRNNAAELQALDDANPID